MSIRAVAYQCEQSADIGKMEDIVTEPPRDEPFRFWFRRQLLEREWTQADFARRSGIAHNVISQWATGRRLPSPESCQTIANHMYLPLDEVLRAVGIRPGVSRAPDHLTRIRAMIERVNWTPDRLNGLQSLLESWIEFDRRS